jgi:toxin ParE1/3/4
MPYRLSALAERDLDEIWSYVAEDASPTTADRLIDAIIDRFELLAEQPRIGRLRPEFGPGVRSFTVENHVILWSAKSAAVGSQKHAVYAVTASSRYS